MSTKAAPSFTPKRLLVVPKKAALLAPKSSAAAFTPKAPLGSNKVPLIVPKLAPVAKVAASPAALNQTLAQAVVGTEKEAPVSRHSSIKLGEGRAIRDEGGERSHFRTSSSRPISRQLTPVEAESEDKEPQQNNMDVDSVAAASERVVSDVPLYMKMRSHDTDRNSKQNQPDPAMCGEYDQPKRSPTLKSYPSKSDKDLRQGNGSAGKMHHDDECPNAVGETPWLQIERRINEIRSLASANMHQISARSNRANDQGTTSIYGNYNTHYEPRSEWKKECSHPMSYGMVQSLRSQKPASNNRDSWNFVDGFLKPRRKPFASMSELSRHFRNINPNEQSELIKLLLACRDLEKVIEEQHAVLDMLDHDLREAREIMKLPEHLRDISTKKLAGNPPQKEPFYPTSDIPLFIKGRVSLMPDRNDVRLSVVNNR